MKYIELCRVYEKLESTTKNLEKRDIAAELFEKSGKKDLRFLVLGVMGKVFPDAYQKELGIASKMMIKAISHAFGIKEGKVIEYYKEEGDLGRAAEKLMPNKKQKTLMKKDLTVDKIFKNLRKLPHLTGHGSQDKKISHLKELLSYAKPVETRYIVRTVLGEMRIGVGRGTVRDALSKAFSVPAEKVERAYNLLTDYGEVASIIKGEGEKGLENVDIEIGRPMKVMLAEASPGLESALKSAVNPVLEIKFDGARVQIHKKNGKVKVFTRRLEDVTEQFPDIVDISKKALKGDCIVEGEAIGLTENKKNLVPFQKLSRRIQRKYDIKEMVEKIPVKVKLFDIVYLNGKNLMDNTQQKRRELLEKTVNETEGIELAKELKTKDIEKAQKFYDDALKNNQEGLMIKNLNATYQPGKRVGYWYKVKPVMETLDVVITSAEWGTGKRAHWLSSYTLSVRDPHTDELLKIGKMGSGLTEKQLEDMTKRLKKLITKEEGRTAIVQPEIVVEVLYNEIQKSPNYDSGYALRFPRLKRIREDKSPDEADTVERVAKLYEQQ